MDIFHLTLDQYLSVFFAFWPLWIALAGAALCIYIEDDEWMHEDEWEDWKTR